MHRIATFAIAIAAGLALTSGANAAASDKAARPAKAGPAALDTRSKGFADTVAISNQYEIDAAKIAQMRGQSDDVKNFAQTIIQDHTKAGMDLKEALQQANARIVLPTKLDARHAKLIDTLQKASASKFDADYVNQQVQAHQQASKLLQTYAMNGTNPQLKMFASNTLPTIKMHLQTAQMLQKAEKPGAQARNAVKPGAPNPNAQARNQPPAEK